MASPEPEYVKVKKSLRNLIWDGSFWGIMEGFSANFIVPFGLFLHASNLLISLLSSLPDLLASVFQLFAIKVNESVKSRKAVIVFGVMMQAALWIPLLLIPRFVPETAQAFALIAIYSLILMFAYFNSPIWRGVVGDLVPENERGAYFGKRNKIIAIVNFTAGLMAGGILQYFSKTNPLLGFTILFGVAFVARVISGLFLAQIYEKPVFNPNVHKYPGYKYTLFRFLKDLTKTDYGKFVLIIFLFRIAVSFTGPFYSVYELKHLGFSYWQYIILLSAEIVASVLSLSLWGKINDDRGSKSVIVTAGLMIPFIPLAYLVSANYMWLFAVSLFSGAAWAGFNLAIGNFLFDAASPQERVRYASYYQLFNGFAIFFGTISGGFLMSLLPDTAGSVLTLFLISGIGRLAVAAMLFPMLREMRLIELPFGKSFFEYPLIIKPRQRFVQDPFEYYLAYPNKPKRPRPRLYLDDRELYNDPEEEKKKEILDARRDKSNRQFLNKMLGKDENFNRFFKKK